MWALGEVNNSPWKASCTFQGLVYPARSPYTGTRLQALTWVSALYISQRRGSAGLASTLANSDSRLEACEGSQGGQIMNPNAAFA